MAYRLSRRGSRRSVRSLSAVLLAAAAGSGVLAPVHAAPALIDAQAPDSAISNGNPTLRIPVTLQRTDSAGVRLFHVEFTVSNLVLPQGRASIAEGSFLDSLPGTRTAFEVLDEGGGTYSADGVILGVPCGRTALFGTLFTVTVAGTAQEGIGTLLLGEVALRDCDNLTVDALAGPGATVFVDRSPPLVSVTSPAGGEIWIVDSPQWIRWSASDAFGVRAIDIDYSTDGGATYPGHVASGLPNTGSYAWTVPNTPSAQVRVRVVASDSAGNAAAAASPGNFAIGYFAIAASGSAGGTITPSGHTAVRYGGGQHYAIAPTAGYHIQDVRVDGVSVGPSATYDFTNVTASHTIEALFDIDTGESQGISVYSSPSSVAPGDSLFFHISSTIATLDVRFYHFEKGLNQVLRINGIHAQHFITPDSSFAKGCGWPVTLAVQVPVTWPSGVYLAQFFSPLTLAYTNSIFVVHPSAPGSLSKIVFIVPYSTYVAYNTYGGKSLYDAASTGGARSSRVSLDRPFASNNGAGGFDGQEGPFTSWFLKNGFIAEYWSNIDLALDPELLNNYNLAIIAGHHEYWSKEERDAFDNFRDRGGRIALFNANCAYWQVRVENAGRTLVCYKDRITDPVHVTDPARTTVRFRDPPVNRPEASLLGVMYGSNANGYARSVVVADTGWIFNGTQLLPGDSAGTRVVGDEWDDASPFAPSGTRLEFSTPVNPLGGVGGRSCGSFYCTDTGWGSGPQRGSKVFSAGTVDWCVNLDTTLNRLPVWQVQRITRNVLQDLCQGDSTNRAKEVVFRLDLRGIPVSAGRQVGITVPGTAEIPGSAATMSDDGAPPDSAPGDLVYTTQFTFPPGMPKPAGYFYTFVNSPGLMDEPDRRFSIVDTAGAPEVQVLPPDHIALTGAVGASGTEVPFALMPAGPNPFGHSTAIAFSVPRSRVAARTAVRIEVCDAGGRLVRVLRDGPAFAITGKLTWDGRDRTGRVASSGIYFCRMSAGAETATSKLVLLR